MVYEGFVGQETGGAYYPQLRAGGWQGVDLNRVGAIVEGRTYEVVLEKCQFTLSFFGDFEIEDTMISRVVFELFVDPELPSPEPLELEVSTDDETGTFEIAWSPDEDFDYLVLSELETLVPDRGPQTLFSTPAEPAQDHVFTDQITGPRQFYVVLPIPK